MVSAALAPLCCNCQHFTRSPGSRFIFCDRPTGEQVDPVNGMNITCLGADHRSERRPGRTWFGLGRERCGPEGKFFEPYEPRTRPVPRSADDE